MDEFTPLGYLQLECMEIIWNLDRPVTVQEVADKVNESRALENKLAYTTILTVMRNMAKRRVLHQKKKGRRG